MRRVVVFPAPFGPSNPSTSPAWQVRSIPSTTHLPPSDFRNPVAESRMPPPGLPFLKLSLFSDASLIMSGGNVAVVVDSATFLKTHLRTGFPLFQPPNENAKINDATSIVLFERNSRRQ